MKRIYFIVILVIYGFNLSAQRKWELKTKVETNTYFILEGKINNKHSIRMYLQEAGSCGENSNNPWNAVQLEGWYYYKKTKLKIPLIGSYKKYEEGSPFMKLYVPLNLIDALNENTCDVKNYKEEFRLINCCVYGEMQWRKRTMDTFQNVSLKVIHPFSHGTTCLTSLEFDGIEMATFNITKLTNLHALESAKVLAKKKIGNNLYVILRFSEPTRPGSNGGGTCGAGYEGYIGYIHINSSLKLAKFDFKQIYSCIKEPVICYCYDKNHPEKGLFIDKERKCCDHDY